MQCEGFGRFGGAFTFGTPVWMQCTNVASVTLTVTQEGNKRGFPVCMLCWRKAVESGIEINAVAPLRAEEINQPDQETPGGQTQVTPN